MKQTLALFDLDHTLLSGDSDVLWCQFLMAEAVLERTAFEARNADMETRYRAGQVSAAEFSAFYVATLAGRSATAWAPLRERYLQREILPRIPAAARALVARHRQAGDLCVMTTATNRFLTEPTARHLGFEHLIATECELGAGGVFTGHPTGVLNMRDGKVTRLQAWLAARGETLDGFGDSIAYSDSINDLPLLSAVRHAVAVDPDARLAAEAASRGWPLLHLR
ncbi:MAG: HAD family hydrolase [Rubrivivax sp.]